MHLNASFVLIDFFYLKISQLQFNCITNTVVLKSGGSGGGGGGGGGGGAPMGGMVDSSFLFFIF